MLKLSGEQIVNYKKLLSIIFFVVFIILASLMLTGCPRHIDSLYGVKVVGDGAGGAIALYEDKLGGIIYAQKINSNAKLEWGENGVLLGRSDTKNYSFFSFNLVSDGSGGAIIVWPDSSWNQLRPVSHLARISAEGKKLWQHDFISFDRIISDGSGGSIIAFDHSAGIDIAESKEEDLTLVKVDSQGSYTWGPQGVKIPRINYQDNTLQIMEDGSGGIIVLWQELETEPVSPGQAKTTNSIFAQKVNSEGKLAWKAGVVDTAPEGVFMESAQITGDGAGGAIISWFQVTNIPAVGSGNRSQIWDVAVQKVDAGGQLVWQPGVLLGISKAASNAVPGVPVLTGNGSGGAAIIWRDNKRESTGPGSIYAQVVDADGKLKWQPGGIQVSSASLNPRALISTDGSGNVIVVYSFQEDWKILHAQKLDSSGRAVWQTNGIAVTENGFAGDSISSDGQGGVIVGWGVGQGIFRSEKAFAQRISPAGELMWGEGVRLNP